MLLTGTLMTNLQVFQVSIYQSIGKWGREIRFQ